MQIYNNDCLEEMKNIKDNSINLIFCDLPYGQTSCKWDCKIDLNLFWKQVMRIKKLNTPIFFTTTTKFGVELITSAPKKCHFRYDIVWVKSAPAGFLSAKKMPMRKHEMIYVFYEKLPFYDLSTHTHKFIKSGDKGTIDNIYGQVERVVEGMKGKYNPPLPVSVVKEEIIEPNEDYDKREKKTRNTIKKEENYGKGYLDKKINFRKYDATLGGKGAPSHLYDPPLPVSVVKEEKTQISKCKDKDLYGDMKGGTIGNVHGTNYEPPLPVSVVKEEIDEKYKNKGGLYSKVSRNGLVKNEPHYDPPLPTTMLEVKSTRGKHSTEKPVALMEWILKYYSKEGDTILDPTMGSGSTGVACKNMNRKFIGIEMDKDIYKVAEQRLEINNLINII